MLSWDESRLFAVDWAVDWADQVKQHRRHASIAIWSFCNELSCSMADIERAGPLYQTIAKGFDPDRATSGNLLPDSKCNSPLIKHIDLIGTSYGSTHVYEACHRLHPNMSLLVSEDKAGEQLLRNVGSVVPIARSDDGKQVELPFVMGWIGAWTLFDYFGEARTPVSADQRPWPQVSSRFGAFDLAGVPSPGNTCHSNHSISPRLHGSLNDMFIPRRRYQNHKVMSTGQTGCTTSLAFFQNWKPRYRQYFLRTYLCGQFRPHRLLHLPHRLSCLSTASQ
jgi:hypothetical protein